MIPANYVAPVTTGGWAQLQWYWTDTVWSGFYYGQSKNNLSNLRKGTMYNPATGTSIATIAPYGSQGSIGTGAIESQQEYHVNIAYDPNPAIRLGLEYSYYITHYARNLYDITTINSIPSGLTSQGTVNTIRFSAQYFF